MTPREVSRAIIRASMALDRDHPAQSALYAAHAAIFNPIAAERPTALVDHRHSVAACADGRESNR
jgi:hypothetical protein